MFEKCGTPCYVAPEILRGFGYGTKCDIFSLGSLLFNLLTGRFLFSGNDKKEVLRQNKICNIDLTHEYLKDVSPEARDLLYKMISDIPQKRFDAREALKHPWFSKN